MDSSSLLLAVPITISPEKHRNDFDSLKYSCSKSQARSLSSWGNLEASSSLAVESGGLQPGALIGTTDGSIYFFKYKDVHLPTPRTVDVPGSRAISPSSQTQDSRTPSRSSTPNVTSPLPFNVAPRARIVSGITADSVEAPKNYVDFDDEPEKLKGMLKGKSAKENRGKRESYDEASLKALASCNSSSRSTSTPPTSNRKIPSKPPPPVTPRPTKVQTPALSLTLSSPPASTSRRPELEPWCHVVLSHKGTRNSVTKLHILEDHRLAFVLQEMGIISVVSLQDGTCLTTADANLLPLEPPSGIPDKNVDHDVWLWDDLSLVNMEESALLLVTASTDSNYLSPATSNLEDSNALELSRIVLLEVSIEEQISAAPNVHTNKVGEWHFDGIPSSAGIHAESGGTLTFYFTSNNGDFLVREVQLLSKGIYALPDSSLEEDSPPYHTIPLPNPFRNVRSRSSEHLNVGSRQPGRIQLGEERNLGNVITGEFLQFRHDSTDGSLLGCLWSSEELVMFDYRSNSLRILFSESRSDIQDVQFLNHYSYSILFDDRIEYYAIEAKTGMDDLRKDVIHPRLLQGFSVGVYSVAKVRSKTYTLTINMSDEDVPLSLTLHNSSGTSILWNGSHIQPLPPDSEVTSLLPLDLDFVIAGYADGCLRQTNLLHMLTIPRGETPTKISRPSLDAAIVTLSTVVNARTNETFIVGGGDDGSIAFWTINQFQLVAHWTIFLAPLRHVVYVEDHTETPLKGCALCISSNGTIAVIAVDGFQFLYVVPGAAAPLAGIYLGGTNLMLIYADRRARLWDVHTREFWRSMKLDKAKEMLEQGGWTTLPLEGTELRQNLLCGLPGSPVHDIATTILLNLERVSSESAALARTISTNRDQTRAILKALERLRAILSVLLTPGLSSDIDGICFNKLGIQPAGAAVGISRLGSTTLYGITEPRGPWVLSPEATASRLLSLAIVLQTISIYEEFIEGANTVLIFYATSLASVIGPTFQRPSLVYLAHSWFAGSSETRKAARTVFDYTVASLSDEESNDLAQHWHHDLPCLQPDANKESNQAALALYICGYLAGERYSLLPTSTLIDISKSIALYLHDEQSLHRVLAVDLCSRGFHVWQHYIDAMEILRALFTLATTTRKDSINLQNVASQARLAVLHIVSSDTALFMHTLGLDILNPPSLEHRKSVLQIVAFLVRKRPLVLQPNVPKLLEAVVKSLDPSVTTHRDAVFDSATEIIGYVVNTFPSVDFNSTVQRLAVGTEEGAVIMYDVKTAIRLYVLEGHKHSVAACSFSPDGRRLLSLSLQENAVLVWKVGMSFTSFFTPGVPPRQGHGGSEPFKRFNFHLTAEGASMSLSEARELIKFDWTGDRSVKLKIRDTVMSFST